MRQGSERRYDKARRECLYLIKKYYTFAESVKLSADRRPVGKKRFQELNAGGKDDWRIPVIHQLPGMNNRILWFITRVVIFLSASAREAVLLYQIAVNFLF